MRSPLTGQDAAHEPCDKSNPYDDWLLIRERDGTEYVASRDFIQKCERSPLPFAQASALMGRVKALAQQRTLLALATEMQGRGMMVKPRGRMCDVEVIYVAHKALS